VWFCAGVSLTNGHTVEYERRIAALSDALTMSLMAGVDAACMLLRRLIRQLRSAVQQLQLLVPETVYLPAPPIFCPQPDVTAQVVLVAL